MRHRRSGAEELRLIVSNLNRCAESFLDDFDAAQLLAIGRAQLGGEWDITPDQWSPRQVREALSGIPPRFIQPEPGDLLAPLYRGELGDFVGQCQEGHDLSEADAGTCPTCSAGVVVVPVLRSVAPGVSS